MNICLNLNNEESKKITNVQELAAHIQETCAGTNEMSDEERAKMDAKIHAKLEAGKKLSQKELDYLRRTNPMLYAHAMRVQRIAKTVEEQLKHAQSKEEANHIISSSLSGISKNDPDKEYIVAAVNRVEAEFHKSGAYQKLPNTIEAAKKKHGDQSLSVKFSDAEDDEEDNHDNDDDFDVMSWSPLNEVYDSLPSFSVGV